MTDAMYGLHPELYLKIYILDGNLGVHGHGLRLDGVLGMHSQGSKLDGGSGVHSYRILLVLPYIKLHVPVSMKIFSTSFSPHICIPFPPRYPIKGPERG